MKVTSFCRIISEFALEYRTTRERVLTIRRKRTIKRERNKTRGMLITEVTLRGQRSGGGSAQFDPQQLNQPPVPAVEIQQGALLHT